VFKYYVTGAENEKISAGSWERVATAGPLMEKAQN
jgi:hypothetical protein